MLISMISIVVTNAIVLREIAQHKIEAGADVRPMLIQGGRTHVRPMLMTAAATILALIPLVLSSDDGLIVASLATVGKSCAREVPLGAGLTPRCGSPCSVGDGPYGVAPAAAAMLFMVGVDGYYHDKPISALHSRRSRHLLARPATRLPLPPP